MHIDIVILVPILEGKYGECSYKILPIEKFYFFNYQKIHEDSAIPEYLDFVYTKSKETGQKFIVKINDEYFLKYLSQDKHLAVPNIDDDDIIIYLPKRGTCTYAEKDYKGNDKEFLDLHNAWTAEQIAVRPDKALRAIGFYSFTALIDMKPKPGARYIHSASEPYNEEQELSQRIDAWIDHFNMNKFQSHCSGHARGRDLLDAVKEIEAKMIFPIHTEHPAQFKKILKNVTLVEEVKKFIL